VLGRNLREDRVTLRPAGYRDRLVDPQIERLRSAIGAISIEGPRWCGKTWTSLNHAESAYFVADPTAGFRNREVARLDLTAALAGPEPHLIDEWQEVPGLWDAVRFEVDQGAGRGRFILTGSSMPADDTTTHTGIGRIGRVALRPMSLVESGDSTGEVSLSHVMAGAPVTVAASTLTLPRVAELVVRGGWPGALDLTVAQAADLARSYVTSLAREDLARVDPARRDPSKVAALLASLARNTATTVGQAAILRDIAQWSDENLSATTLRHYLSLLQRLYVLEQIPAWTPALRSPIRLRQAPKRILVDPSLAAAALNASPAQLAREPKTLGLLFESLVLRDLLVYAQSWDATLSHYQDDAGLECDAIVSLRNGDWVAVEIKLGYVQEDAAAATLLRLHDKMTAAGHPAPAALIAIIGVGSYAHRRPDGVAVLPADLLGP
jgi:predicted AAA+ superfamily ATPase